MFYLPSKKKSLAQRKYRHSLQAIKGSAIMIALFVIVVMAMLGAALVNMQSTSSEAIAQEVLGTRALAAARSGMQGQLQALFPLDSTSTCPAEPSSKSVTYDFSTLAGLQQCSATVVCSRYAVYDSVNYYRLTSTGECGSGTMASDSKNIVKSSRTIRVDARNL